MDEARHLQLAMSPVPLCFLLALPPAGSKYLASPAERSALAGQRSAHSTPRLSRQWSLPITSKRSHVSILAIEPSQAAARLKRWATVSHGSVVLALELLPDYVVWANEEDPLSHCHPA